MASIQNVRLEIVENQGAAAALVTFNLIPSPQDVQEHRTYSETVELIGVDQGAGEDGIDELIPGSRSIASVTFPLPAPGRKRLIALQGSSLDEDRPSGPIVGFTDNPPDEIRARVTLSFGVIAESGTVPLHVIVNENVPTPV